MIWFLKHELNAYILIIPFLLLNLVTKIIYGFGVGFFCVVWGM